MHEGLIRKLELLNERLEEINSLLADAEIISNQKQFRDLSIEHAHTTPIVECYQGYLTNQADLESLQDMLRDEDTDVRKMAKEEQQELFSQQENLQQELQLLLLPKDPLDDCNIYLEIRAGTGGDEAAIFSGDLFRMYARYAEQKNWTMEVISRSEGEHGGYKEIISRIVGQGAYSQLKFESGVHRVQRVPTTESQGRIHTSACTVAIIAERDEIDEIEINPADLRIDTFRASGAGGQHVNKTDSAIRLTHLPSGIVVECQDGRSQHKNKAHAMSLLKARILAVEEEKQQREEAQTRRAQVGSGDRSERIRTYNFPQGRITDHRINLTLYKLEDVLSGALAQVIDPLIKEQQAANLMAINNA